MLALTSDTLTLAPLNLERRSGGSSLFITRRKNGFFDSILITPDFPETTALAFSGTLAETTPSIAEARIPLAPHATAPEASGSTVTLTDIAVQAAFETSVSIQDSTDTPHEITRAFFHTGPRDFRCIVYTSAGEIASSAKPDAAVQLSDPISLRFGSDGLRLGVLTSIDDDALLAAEWATGGTTSMELSLADFSLESVSGILAVHKN